MKALALVLAIVSLFALSAARADQPKPQPCDSSWEACAIGRSDFEHPGRYIIDILFLSQDDLKNNTPVLGAGSEGDVTQIAPYLQASVDVGSTDVLLQVTSSQGQPLQTFVVGKLAQPIGSDMTQYYTRQIQLSPGIRIQSTSSSSTHKYCDPGGVFGAENYIQRITEVDSVISGMEAEPFKIHTSRLKILFNYPAVFGC